MASPKPTAGVKENIMKTRVIFEYCELSARWEVFVEGVVDGVEARQAFNAVLISSQEATPSVAANRAEQQPDGRWKIIVGVFHLRN
jgi:hypothetical protein